MPSFSYFFPPNVFRFISDRSVDFKLDETKGLNDEQREFLAVQFNIPDVVNIKQVHGDNILIVTEDDFPVKQEGEHKIPEADGLITNRPYIPLAVRTADCVPLFLYDDKTKCVGLIHAGWKGCQKEIAKKSVFLMTHRFKSDAADIKAFIGPCIQVFNYEVGEDLIKIFPNEIKQKHNKYYLDLPLAVMNQLEEAGVAHEHILNSGDCTYANSSLFSYRREKEKAGRMISIMMLLGKK